MNTFLTYDYELFTGSVCGSVGNCLIAPISEILRILGQYQVKGTFFVDASFLSRLNDLRGKYASLQKEYDLLIGNICFLEEQGHDVELHIHPQWYFSSFYGLGWDMDLKHFKLSDVERSEVDELVSQSQGLLESIIGRKVHAFRAGGYSIQDMERYDDFYRDHHLFVDSTVLSGLSFFSENQSYDYSKVNKGISYRFSNDITQEDVNGSVLECPITTAPVSKLQYIEHLSFKRRNASIMKRAGDGMAITPSKNSIYDRASRILGRENYISASFDDANGRWIKRIFDRQLEAGQDFVVISHPKSHTKYSFCKMDEFLKYSIGKTEFKTMSQLISK